MKATQIFGPHLLPMMEYLDEAMIMVGSDPQGNIETIQELNQAHKFLSQPMEISLFLKPQLDIEAPFLTSTDKNLAIANDNWKPLLKGDWTFIRGFVHYKVNGEYRPVVSEDSIIYQSINDFATHCHKKGIKLELNKDFEI